MSAWDRERARAASLETLAPYGFVLPEHFSLLGEEDLRLHRPLEQVVARAQALVCVLNAIHGAPLSQVMEVVGEHELEPWVSASEQEYLDERNAGRDDRHAGQQLSWRSEALFALIWMLGVTDELPLTGIVDLGAELLGPVDPLGGPPPTTLREPASVAARLDLFICAHWAVREHQLRGTFEPWPEELVGGAIWERRHGLEWFFAPTDEWDDLSLST